VFFVWASGEKTIQNAERGAIQPNQENMDVPFSYIFLLLFFRALQIITPTYTRDTFETIEILDRIKPVMKQPKALLGFLKIPTVFYGEALFPVILAYVFCLVMG